MNSFPPPSAQEREGISFSSSSPKKIIIIIYFGFPSFLVHNLFFKDCTATTGVLISNAVVASSKETKKI